MAFTNFYIDQGTGASDLNAGSTSDFASGASAPAFTYAGGTFVRATGVFTVAAGNPETDGVTVGTYASVYTTVGAVAATFVAQITARDATTITVDVTTLKWGVATSVSEAANAATLKVSGAWASEVVLAATGLGTFTAPVSTKINMKGDLTVAASRTVSMAGATTAPIWFSGYNTTPGDLDNDTTNALAKPVWTFNAAITLVTSGTHQLWSGLNVVGAVSGTLWAHSGTQGKFSRCRIETTSSNAAAVAFSPSAANAICAYCWFKAPTTATTSGVVLTGSSQVFIGCVSEGGGLAGFNMAAQTLTIFLSCVGLNNTGSGFLMSTGNSRVLYSTVYNATADGVKWSGTPAQNSCVVGSLFDTCAGVGINNASGTNTNLIFRACNDFQACGTDEAGFGDSPSFFGKTGAGSVVASSTDMTPILGSNARNNGFPGIFENQSYSSYQDIGAVRHADAGGGGIISGDEAAAGDASSVVGLVAVAAVASQTTKPVKRRDLLFPWLKVFCW